MTRIPRMDTSPQPHTKGIVVPEMLGISDIAASVLTLHMPCYKVERLMLIYLGCESMVRLLEIPVNLATLWCDYPPEPGQELCQLIFSSEIYHVAAGSKHHLYFGLRGHIFNTRA